MEPVIKFAKIGENYSSKNQNTLVDILYIYKWFVCTFSHSRSI